MSKKNVLVFVCVSLLSLTTILTAQSGSGSVQGTISDPSGAVIPGASVVATNAATGVKTTRQTTGAGLFVLSPLPAGNYTVSATASGFQPVTQENVIVDALGTVGLNLTLKVGAATEAITVSDAPLQMHTEDATLGQSVRNEVYAALPLAMNGVSRDPTQFVYLVPGVNSPGNQVSGTNLASFNGGQTFQNETYLEGIPLTSAGTEGDTRYLSFGISVEAVEQFQVETSGAKAQFEGQGIGNYVLKSGTNQFHGSAYEYFRNTALDARGFFPATTPIEHQNEFGGSVGGPIIKNRAFFFGSADAYRFNSGSVPALQSIPTLAARTGNFSAYPAVIYDPGTTTCTTAGVCSRTPFGGNTIPANRISPISKSLQSYLPDPTNGSITNNYLTGLPIKLDTHNTTEKVDVTLTDKHRMFGMFSDGHYSTNFTGSLSPGTSALPLPYTQGRIVSEHVLTTQIHDTYTISPSIVNQFSYSYNRLTVPLINATADGNYPQKAGMKGLPPGIASTAFPEIAFNGANSPIGWAGTNARANQEAVNTFTLQNNVLWIKGRHSLTIGFQFQALQDNYNNPLTGTLAGFTFSNNETAGYGPTGTLLTTTGNSYAGYLLGATASGSVTQNAVAETGGRYKTYATYVQDDFKVSSRLTLNLGLRWNAWSPFTEVYNRMSFFNPNIPNPAAGDHLGALQFAGDGPFSCHCSTPIKWHKLNLAPRFGAAYRLGEKTVIRAGYAITFVHAGGVGGRVNGRQGLSQLGFNSTASFGAPSSGVPAFYWDNGFPAYQPPPFINPGYGTGFITANPTGAQTVTYGDPEIGGKAPYYENWSFGLQRSITSNLLATATYSGSAGKFLPGAGPGGETVNIAPLKYLALGSLLTATANPTTIAQAQAQFPEIKLPFPNFVGTVGQMLRPFPQYGTISNPWANLGMSTYHALQTSLNRRYANGFTFTLGYTFSKELDNLLGSPRNPYNAAMEKAPGSINRTHVFTGTYVYALPFGAGKRMNPGNAVARYLVSDWNISGIASYSSGAPLSIVGSACTSGNILGTCFPNYNPSYSGDVRINGNYGDGSVLGSTPTTYLAKSAFSTALPFTVGNVARTAAFGLYAPRTMGLDVSLRRDFRITERVKLGLQTDAFNVTNSVFFGAPAANVDSANFGTLTTQANQPRKLQISARISF